MNLTFDAYLDESLEDQLRKWFGPDYDPGRLSFLGQPWRLGSRHVVSVLYRALPAGWK